MKGIRRILLILMVLLKLHTFKVNALTDALLIDNSWADVKAGETITVTLKVEDIEDIYGMDIALSYNQEVVMPVKERFQEGGLLLGKHMFTAVNRIGNGEAKFMATLLGQEKSLYDQGVLLKASFKVHETGKGDIHIQKIKLLDRTGKKIEFGPRSIQVNVDAERNTDHRKVKGENRECVYLEGDGISIEFAGENVDKSNLKVIDIHSAAQKGIHLRSKVYEINEIELMGGEEIRITINYVPVSTDTKGLGIYYYHAGRRKWLYLGGDIDEIDRRITVVTRDIPFNRIAVFENGEYIQFTDLAVDDMDDSMKRVLMLGFMKGYGDHTFKPDRNITREELLCAMLRTLEVPVLTEGEEERYIDVSPWAEPYIYTAKMLNIIQGYEDGSIQGSQNTSMLEAAVIIDRALKLKEPNVQIGLDNKNEIPSWALKSIERLVFYDILLLENQQVQLTNTISRRDAVALLARIIAFLKV